MQAYLRVGMPSSSQVCDWHKTASVGLRRWIQQETEREGRKPGRQMPGLGLLSLAASCPFPAFHDTLSLETPWPESLLKCVSLVNLISYL